MSAVVTHVRRFTPVDRLMHLLLVVTFMTLAVTGAARAFGETDWGRQLLWLFGGHQRANTIHIIAKGMGTVSLSSTKNVQFGCPVWGALPSSAWCCLFSVFLFIGPAGISWPRRPAQPSGTPP